jgi:hypothetical protein
MKYLLFLSVFCISSCSSVIVTDEPFTQNISNKCFEVIEPFDIFLREDYSSSSYIVGTNESYVRMPGTFLEKKSKALTMPVGSQIKIIKVQDFSHGSNGNCWRVYAVSQYLNRQEFELPACWSLTSNIWVKPKSSWDLKQNQLSLEINTKYLSKVKECKNS